MDFSSFFCKFNVYYIFSDEFPNEMDFLVSSLNLMSIYTPNRQKSWSELFYYIIIILIILQLYMGKTEHPLNFNSPIFIAMFRASKFQFSY